MHKFVKHTYIGNLQLHNKIIQSNITEENKNRYVQLLLNHSYYMLGTLFTIIVETELEAKFF